MREVELKTRFQFSTQRAEVAEARKALVVRKIKASFVEYAFLDWD